ncbi:MAG: tRNA epoxyqueuosine(34) reductase QueG, partial [Candidatus Rokubacteria bacterium]|nr:tRNA epoxyqueuosine(34) reductase QueG [Candidatus Rokubacteria bacterium]
MTLPTVPPPTLRGLALAAAVRERARALGFARVAFGPADPPEHGAAFERWLDAGYAGGMDYLARSRADLLDPRRLLPGA